MDSAAVATHSHKMPDHPTPLLPDNRGWSAAPRVSGILGAASFLALAALVVYLTQDHLAETSGLFLFFLAVLVAAVRFGFWIGIVSAFAAFAMFNFLFVPPLYTFAVADPGDFVVLAEFLGVAAMTGFLAGRLREEANAATSRAAVLEVLTAFAAEIPGVKDLSGIEQVLTRHVSALALGPSLVFRVQNGTLAVTNAWPETTLPGATDLQAADRAYRYQSPQDPAQPGQQGGRYAFLPLVQDGEVVLVLGHHRLDPHRADLRTREQAINVIFQQASLAIERLRLASAADEARTNATRESLRAALLTSLSHDLRTPLATILGAITSLRQLGATLPAAARDDLALAIEEEAQRLARYVDNLLQMTRLQAGIALTLTWVDPGDVVALAVARARRAFPQADISIDLPDLPMIRAEQALLEQTLFNLIDNAVKFSPPPARVLIAGRADDALLTLTVTDFGPGIGPEAQAQIFKPFFRANASASGTGLGLTICKGIVTALGGVLALESPSSDGHGTTVRITLPLTKAPQ